MKFCFFGDISNSLKGKTIGGGELQVALLAKALAAEGHQVVIIDPYSVENFTTAEGIQVVNVPSWNKGIKGLRLFLNRIPALYRLCKEQQADFYYGRMRSYLHIVPYRAARKIKKKYILAIASDIDVMSIKEKYKYEYKANFKIGHYLSLLLPGDIVYNYLLKKADYIVLQHSGQDVNIASMRGKKVTFPNIIDQSNLPATKNVKEDYLLYLGTLTTLKGSHKLLQLVSMLENNTQVVIIGQPTDEKSKLVFDQFKLKPNVKLMGRLPHEQALEFVANAKALINTSEFEGFPNVFLEAWALGVPVISLNVNPGKIFDKYDLGVFCDGDLKKMKESAEGNKMSTIKKESMNAYINEFHDAISGGQRFLNALNS